MHKREFEHCRNEGADKARTRAPAASGDAVAEHVFGRSERRPPSDHREKRRRIVLGDGDVGMLDADRGAAEPIESGLARTAELAPRDLLRSHGLLSCPRLQSLPPAMIAAEAKVIPHAIVAASPRGS